MRLLFCGGGTGGHVYPALAVVEALREVRGGAMEPAQDLLYVGSVGGREVELVRRAGLPLVTIHGGGLHGVGWRRLPGNAVRLLRGFVQAWRIIGRFRPEALFVTGGYVSVPVALAARLRRVPVLVYLPDIEPGLAIRVLSRLATRVAVTAEASRRYLPAGKVVVTGYPVRPCFAAVTREAARAHFGIGPEERVLLVFGGSQGARSINRALAAILPSVLALARVIHISGRLDAVEAQARRAALSPEQQARYHLFDYLHDEEMGMALAAADLAV
ncbi:MAG: UDP-N-acetylglucosamine--N-acetylmuramyl-(pentapeptide) pyrophosphoryl-undecaprenol N-acetylglucosamine transferase, partial [Chloroflexi bacterium]